MSAARGRDAEDWDDWDDEAWEDGSSGAPLRAVPIGYLALVPLLLAYEASLGQGVGHRRNVAEMLFGLALRPAGELEATLRVALLLGLGGLALAFLRGGVPRNLALLFRTVLEGALVALVLGPLLLLLQNLLLDGASPTFLADPGPGSVPSLARVAFVVGGAGYEELVFRLGAYSLCFLVARTVAHFLGAPLVAARLSGDVAGILGSAALFAGAHVRGFAAFLGYEGQPFDAHLFAWQFASGVCLAALFRWRGIGVAAWAHALFNLALVLGAGPGVFL